LPEGKRAGPPFPGERPGVPPAPSVGRDTRCRCAPAPGGTVARAGQGEDTIVDGTVSDPEVGDPVSLMTHSYCPLPLSETASRWWKRTPGRTRAAAPEWRTIVGATV